jgi:hypothetical protein
MTVDVPPGTVLSLARQDWQFGRHRLRLRVARVRWDLSHYYDGERVWVEGESLGADGMPLGRVQALVRTAAIAAAGGALAGAATVAAVRAVSRPRKGSGRRLARRSAPPRRVVASRSFLVDVHLLGS